MVQNARMCTHTAPFKRNFSSVLTTRVLPNSQTCLVRKHSLNFVLYQHGSNSGAWGNRNQTCGEGPHRDAVVSIVSSQPEGSGFRRFSCVFP